MLTVGKPCSLWPLASGINSHSIISLRANLAYIADINTEKLLSQCQSILLLSC